ncbi:MAG: 3-phosphoshikimate 1-carboxyvinyltransferase [Phycisphaeraceae bacterium]|nr:3-phosphoshikimate 1-carboxyvinyltransferase [Phycisphaeraceae bacterium]
MNQSFPKAMAIEPIEPFCATLLLPGSKSLTNRAMLLAALAEGESLLEHVLVADDARVMHQALESLGVSISVQDVESGPSVRITGTGGRLGRPDASFSIFLGNAGTATRFLTAALAMGHGRFHLHGVARMHQRPIGELVNPLRELGASIEYLEAEGCPPLEMVGRPLRGGTLAIGSTLSSQYISALMQIGPLLDGGLTLELQKPITSLPYIQMTARLMERFGVTIDHSEDFARLRINPGGYHPVRLRIEPDASAASYFWAAAALLPGSRCRIEALDSSSLQGDVGVVGVLERMGAKVHWEAQAVEVTSPDDGRLRGVDVDLSGMPDVAQTLAVVALFADGPSRFRGIGNLRVKETDRLAALENELSKLGARVIIDGDDLEIHPPGGGLQPARIATYDDHRMAMSFALAGLRSPGVVIEDPGCVSKSFPEYFEYLQRLAASPARR